MEVIIFWPKKAKIITLNKTSYDCWEWTFPLKNTSKEKLKEKFVKMQRTWETQCKSGFQLTSLSGPKQNHYFDLFFPLCFRRRELTSNFRQKGKQFGVLSEQRSFPCLLAFLTVALMSTEAKESQRCHIRPRTEKGMSWMPFKLQSSSEQRRTAYYSQESPMALVS